MATPANRVPVRIARGSKVNLDTAIAAGDLKEGEICYATDENGIYVVEGGVLTQAGADLASTSIDALADVDTTTAAPTDGQVLIWNNVDGEWQPGNTISDVVSDTTPQLGGNLDVNGNYIVSTSGGNVEVAPDTTGDFVIRGNSTDGAIVLNCTANTHGVKIQSPPHSAAATYTLVLPDDTGTNGQALITDGSGGLFWAAPSADLSATSIDALSDVNTTTVAPTDGQVLVWDNANSVWKPGTVASGSVTSLDDIGDVDTTTAPPTDGQALVWDNTAGQWEPGTVSGGGAVALDDLTDVVAGLQSNSQTWSGTWTIDTLAAGDAKAADGEMGPGGSANQINLYINDASGANRATNLSALNGLTFAWRKNSEAWQTETMTGYTVFGSTLIITAAGLRAAVDASQVGDSYTLSDAVGAIDYSPTDGQVLTWVDANSQWEPATPSGGGATSIDDLTDVDTTTTPPTDGQALVWDNVNSQWEPGTVSGGGGGAVDSVNGQTGVVSLGIQEMDDFEYSDSVNDYTVVYNENPDAQGEARLVSGSVGLYITDNSGADIRSMVLSLPSSGTIQIGTSEGSLSDYAYTSIQALRSDGFDALADYSNAAQFLFRNSGNNPLTLLGVATSYTGSLYVSLGAAPLSDGDILQWVAADSKFKPAQLATVATSGSYNDLADQPTISDTSRIQDQTDFDLNTSIPEYSYSTYTGNFDYANWPNGGWMTNSSSVQLDFQTDDGTTISPGDAEDNWADNDTFNFIQDDVTVLTGSFAVSVASDQQRITIFIGSGNVGSLDTSKALSVQNVTHPPSSQDVPLADGDTLQWNDADQQFQPAQLATVATTGSYNDLADQPTIPAAAPVDSVNGQTGAVSLSVSDLSDITAPQLHRWNVNISGSNVICSSTDGSYAATVSGPNNNIMIMSVDADGNDVSTWFSSWTGTDSLSVYIDGVLVATQQLSFLTYESGFCRNVIRFSSNTIFNAIAAAGASAVLTIQNNTSPQFAGGVPSNGDVLVYNSTNSQYEPSSDYVSLSTLKTEVAASTDFADFQSRIAAL